MLCKYGCGNESKFFFKDGSGCCSDSHNKCPIRKKEISERQIGKKNHAFGKKSWNSGLTRETDCRIKEYVEKGVITKKEAFEYII